MQEIKLPTEKIELAELLTFNHGKLCLDGYDLEEIANMHPQSVLDFFPLLELYFEATQDKLEGFYILKKSQSQIFRPESINKIYYESSNRLSVDINHFESMKKRIFDFAYTSCSNLGEEYFVRWGLDSVRDNILIEKLKNSSELYSCIYTTQLGGWSQMNSTKVINKEDQEKRYALIKK